MPRLTRDIKQWVRQATGAPVAELTEAEVLRLWQAPDHHRHSDKE